MQIALKKQYVILAIGVILTVAGCLLESGGLTGVGAGVLLFSPLLDEERQRRRRIAARLEQAIRGFEEPDDRDEYEAEVFVTKGEATGCKACPRCKSFVTPDTEVCYWNRCGYKFVFKVVLCQS
jgi:hypothetical protein